MAIAHVGRQFSFWCSHAILFLAVMLGAWSVGCQNIGPLAPADLAAPGWETRQGQAVWRPNKDQPEVAGELLLGRHRNGEAVVQFIKTPFPLVTARKLRERWEIQFGPEGRVYSGRGRAPARLIWLHLDDVLLRGAAPPRGWGAQVADEPWRFRNRATGETLEGYFLP